MLQCRSNMEHDIQSKKTETHTNTTLILLFIISIAAITGAGYLWYLNDELEQSLLNTNATLDSRTHELATASSRIDQLESTLIRVRDDLEDLEDDYQDEKNKNDEFEDQIRRITGTVQDLDKLSKTDEELLQKYSKVYFLNENYVPSDLDEIDDEYVQDDREPEFFHADAMRFLEDLMEEAEDDGIDITIISAYRSFDEQREVKNGHAIVFGEGANTFSADQGYSEHQLGTAVDFGTSEITSALEIFAETAAYEWLLDNAHRFGFILSYPEGNQYYIFEPWHWRFVGEELAEDLEDDGDNFYDWEQRKIDEYLIKIFD